MKYLTLAVLVVLSAVGSQAQTQAAPANPKIYVDPATGFDAYLSQAAARNHVAITLTTQKSDADFEFDAVSGGETVPGSKWSILWLPGKGKAWIRLVDLSDSGLVFTCAVDRGLQIAAESCAKRLRVVFKRSGNPSGGWLKPFLFDGPEFNY
jgi:hypothetical protein